MALTYGGVPLLVPTPELAAWIESNISTADVNEFARPFWPGGVHHDWPVPTHKDANRPIKLNRLYWPRGAARWAVGHFLATDGQLTLIRRQATAGGVHAPLTLVMAEGSSTIRKISTSLYMLPARPLQQLVGVDKKKAEGLWLITLVDERYYFWERSGTVAINDGVTTWAQLYAAIGTCLGVTITADTVASEYLLPSKEFANHPQCLPLMLDAVAASVGHKIIRKLDGTVHAQGPTTAKASFVQQRPTLSPRQAGGEFAFDVNKPPTDLASLVPSSVTVKFQRKDDDVFAGASYNVQKTLASLALGDYRGITGRNATQVIHCAAVAAYTAAVLGNGTELGTLASAIARDWYLWRLARLDWKAAGITPWVPEGLHDSVEWSFASGDMSTRIQRPEWNDISTATQMVGVQGSEGDVFNYYEDLYVTNLYVTNINGGDTCVAIDGEATGTAALTSTTWTDIPGTSVSVTVTNEATAQLTAVFHFDGNDTAAVTYDGSGAGSADVYEGRFLIDGASAGPIAKCSLVHPTEEKTIALHPILVTLPVGTYTVKMQARRASGSGQALAGMESGFTLISACSGGGVGPNITVNNLVVNNYLTYSPYEVTLIDNTTNFTITSSTVLVNLTVKNVTIENILFSRTFLNGDIITIINTSTAYYLTLKITGNIESYSLTEVTIGPNMTLKLVYFAADITIPRTAGVKLYKDPCWHQPYRPSQITSTQTSYPLAWSVTYFDFDFSADWSILGFANFYPGRLFFCFNRSAFTLTIPHDSSSATAAQRVYTQTGQNAYIGPNQGAWLQYDGNAQRWRQLTGQVRVQMSITDDAAGLKLVNDENVPADGTFYAKAGGSKGWKAWSDVSPVGALAWVKVTKTYTDLAAANTTNQITVYTLPAKGIVHGAALKTTAAFSGGAIATYSLDLGDSTSASGYVNGYNGALFTGANWSGSGAKLTHGATGSNDLTATMPIYLQATSTGANLDQATAGSVEIWLLISTMP